MESEFEQQAKMPAPSSQAAVKSDGEKSDQDDDTKEGRRQYKFAWDKKAEDEMSDITISSVHTSDLSLFSDGERSCDEGQISEKDEGMAIALYCLSLFVFIASVDLLYILLLLLLLYLLAELSLSSFSYSYS